MPRSSSATSLTINPPRHPTPTAHHQPSPPPNPNSLLNVLIAIVSDSYASAMAQVDELFWMARLAVVTEVNTIFR